MATSLLALTFLNSLEGQRAAKLAVGKTIVLEEFSFASEPDWAAIVPQLSAAASSAERIVTSNSMKALYYIGRYDYEFNVSTMGETESGVDFGLDERTGRPAIGTASALRTVIEQPGMSLIVIEDKKLGIASGVTADAVQLIRNRCEALEVPTTAGVSVWRCGAKRGGA